MTDLSFRDISDLFEAVRWKFWSPKSILSMENLGTCIQLSCSFPDTSAALLYDAQLTWYAILSNPRFRLLHDHIKVTKLSFMKMFLAS